MKNFNEFLNKRFERIDNLKAEIEAAIENNNRERAEELKYQLYLIYDAEKIRRGMR